MLESLLNKGASLKHCNFIKKRLQHRVNIANFLRTTFFTEHLRRLLLIVTAILQLYALIINNMRKLEISARLSFRHIIKDISLFHMKITATVTRSSH